MPNAKKSEMAKAIEAARKCKQKLSGITVQDIRDLKKDIDKTIDKAKRESQVHEQRESLKRPAKSTRSGLKRGALAVKEYTLGKVILMGMKDAEFSNFTEEELETIKKRTSRIKEVKNLKYENLQYIVKHLLLPELKGIQNGEIESDFHDRYNSLVGKNKKELYSEMRMTLFTNEQRDYLNGYLQELFGANKKDEQGDINHGLINYVELVMLHETSVRIVKLIHKFDTFEETIEFMKQKSRETYGLDD